MERRSVRVRAQHICGERDPKDPPYRPRIPSDYALFVCAAFVYEAWSQAGALANSLNLGASQAREFEAYRLECFWSLRSEVEAVAAVSTGGTTAETVRYNISSAYFNLARALSGVATKRASFAFYTGVTVGRISGSLSCIASLSVLCAEVGRELDEQEVASIWHPAEDAWTRLEEYACSLGVSLKSTLGRAPSAKRLSTSIGSCRSALEACDELLSASLAS